MIRKNKKNALRKQDSNFKSLSVEITKMHLVLSGIPVCDENEKQKMYEYVMLNLLFLLFLIKDLINYKLEFGDNDCMHSYDKFLTEVHRIKFIRVDKFIRNYNKNIIIIQLCFSIKYNNNSASRELTDRKTDD